MAGKTALKPLDRIEITTVLDNMVDVLLPSSEGVKRYLLQRDFFETDVLVAEHGFAALVKVVAADRDETVLFDAGLSKQGLMHNLDVMEIKPTDLHAIVLSHGHADHTNGLMGLAKRLGGRKIPLILHPDAFTRRRVVFPDGREINLPPPDRAALSQEGIEFAEDDKPSYLLGGLLLITGQIGRTTDFETGLPAHQAWRSGAWEADPWVHDDQALVAHVKDKGLVVLTGCGHAGVINTVRHAQRITGIERVHAVIGGFHLSGMAFEPIIPPTITALKELQPGLLVPAHCTGWKAVHAIAQQVPEAFVQNSVGTRFIV